MPTRQPTARNERVLALLTELAEMARVVRRKTEEHELDETNVRLLALAQEQGGVRPSDLTEALGLGPPSVSRRIRVLQQAGQLEAEPDPNDKRGYRVRCTDAGTALLARFQADLSTRFGRLIDDWSDDDLDSLTELLGRLNQRIAADEASRPSQPPSKNWWRKDPA